MEDNPYQNREPHIVENAKLRTPQKEAFEQIVSFVAEGSAEREVGIVLPVGCGKSGCITITPFAFKAMRTLVIAPGTHIAGQLQKDFDPTNDKMFYIKCKVLDSAPYPEPVEIRGTSTNKGDLDEADVVITNIQQLAGAGNKWLKALPANYFDLILFDEGHHSVAATFENLKKQFPKAKIVNFSATPLRADGQMMAGRILYSYPIFRAIKEGYVKRLKAVQLNPRTLRYVRRSDGQEIEVELEEVRRLGENDADFRRSIVTSQETLDTIVDVSIRELERLRKETGENRLKIIASALNFEHCAQIVEAYRARGRRADFVHSKSDGKANEQVMGRLENHELDVIVQVRKLGEGFDHPHLAVAAVFSIFSNLSPFVQFVGRIMRVIKQDAPDDIVNQGVVVFHAGANVASKWTDFQKYSEADQEYFDQLLPLDGIDPADASTERETEPVPRDLKDGIEVRAQSDVGLEEIHLLKDDAAMAALRLLKERGYSPEDISAAYGKLEPVPTTKVLKRQAARGWLDQRVSTEVGKILGSRKINPKGKELDTKFLGKENYAVVKSAIDKLIAKSVGRNTGERHEYTASQLDDIKANFDSIVTEAMTEVFGGSA